MFLYVSMLCLYAVVWPETDTEKKENLMNVSPLLGLVSHCPNIKPSVWNEYIALLHSLPYWRSCFHKTSAGIFCFCLQHVGLTLVRLHVVTIWSYNYELSLKQQSITIGTWLLGRIGYSWVLVSGYSTSKNSYFLTFLFPCFYLFIIFFFSLKYLLCILLPGLLTSHDMQLCD